MAELLITLIGLALFGTGWLGMLRPGTGAQPDRVARILQVITGLIMMIIGVVHNSDPSLLTHWIKLIGDYIALLNSHQVDLVPF